MSKVLFHRLPAVCERYGLSRSAIYRMMEKDQFPAPVKIGPRAVAWHDDVLIEHDRKILSQSNGEFLA